MVLEKLNTEQLIELCKINNQSAQLEIYNRYYKAMYNTAFRIVKDSFEAEDIMQDSFLMAFTKLEKLKEAKTFGSWLKRIVINNSIQHYNTHSKNIKVPLDNVLYKIDDENNANYSAVGYESLKARQVLSMLGSLKENYRIALTLNLIEGYDYEKISDIMNISYANSRTTISRAKESLRQKLQTTISYQK
ncbi:RNA polymerase sigma factor [Snuella sedimenti]|uniref:RNA polymerase sigma factor n=1 Tax=Snuella sedimenti TaxID=2798802 RepID=A0A8J7LMK3_9FLAO|nr:RNA polymerase sigma factor [Snuella sedimenti]MBJ6367659.1 RNA polymerase sigma factor [Snuella sedimenti]